jgi:hypothetical protein
LVYLVMNDPDLREGLQRLSRGGTEPTPDPRAIAHHI